MRERVGGEIVVKFISLVGASNFLLVGVGSWRTYTPRASDRDDLQGGEMLLVGLLVGQIWYCCGGGALVCLFKSFFFQESNLLHRVRRSWHDGGSVRIFRDSIINKWLRCRRECFNFGKDHTRPIAMPFGLGSGGCPLAWVIGTHMEMILRLRLFTAWYFFKVELLNVLFHQPNKTN